MLAIFTFVLVLIVLIFLFHLLSKQGFRLSSMLTEIFNTLKSNLTTNRESRSISYFNYIKYFLLYISIFLFIILFITGFIPTLFDDHFLTGLPLIIHVTAAPVFALSLAILILFYSFKLKLNQNDFNNLVQGKNLIRINPTTVVNLIFCSALTFDYFNFISYFGN